MNSRDNVHAVMSRMERTFVAQRAWFERSFNARRRLALMPLLRHGDTVEFVGIGGTYHRLASAADIIKNGWSVVEEEMAPPPRFIHPHYRGAAQTVRAWLDGDLFGGVRGHKALALPRFDEDLMIKSMLVNPTYDEWNLMDQHDLLSYVGRAWHIAPFVGDPFIYWWRIAKDQSGRFCSGEQHLRYMDTWEYERLRGREPWSF